MLYVQASLLALHATELPESRVDAWLRINTPVEVLAEDGDMVRVRLLDRPEEHQVTGWVQGSYLDTELLTVRETWDGVVQARRTRDPESEAMWLERTLAVDPSYSPARTEPLPEEAWLAVCEGNAQGARVELMGRISEEGFTPDVPLKGRQQLVDLSAQHWVRVAPQKPEPIQGSPFVAPFGTEPWNESGWSAYEPGTCEGICEDYAKVVLGPCEDPGAFYVSQPIVKGRGSSVPSRAWVEEGRAWVSIELDGMELRSSVAWSEPGAPPPAEPELRWLYVGEARYALVAQGGANWGGYRVFRVERDKVETDSVQLWGSGC